MRCEALPSILSVFPNSFDKFNNAGARMQDSIYHMTIKSQILHYNVTILPSENATFFMDVNA